MTTQRITGAGKDPTVGFECVYRVMSFVFHLRTDLPGVGEHLDQLLHPFRVPQGSRASGLGTPSYEIRAADDSFEAYLDDERMLLAASLSTALDWVLSDTNAKAIEGNTSQFIIHAGAVCLDGMGVLLPAPPDSGKTTTTAGLVQAGFEYLTDEAALLDPVTGALHPYPRPLWLERPSVAAVFGEEPPDLAEWAGVFYHLAPDRLRRGSIGSSCRVRYVVAPMYVSGGVTRLERVSRAEGLMLLAKNSFSLGRFGADGVRLLERVLDGVDCFRLQIGDLKGAVAAVSGLFPRG
jgi:hypothetical protein